jgi:hypothetical protein
MSFSPWGFIRRTGVIFLLFCCSGCIFIRLSRVLVQMKTPEEELVVDLNAIPFAAELKNPIVLLSDVETLLHRKAVPCKDYFRLEFEKSGPQDREPWGINFWCDKGQRIQKFEMPPRLSQIMGNRFIMSAIEAIGYAEVSIGKRRIYMNLRHFVRRDQALELMGKPFEEKDDHLIYKFGEDEGAFVVTMVGKELLSQVVMEANGYGLEVEVMAP